MNASAPPASDRRARVAALGGTRRASAPARAHAPARAAATRSIALFPLLAARLASARVKCGGESGGFTIASVKTLASSLPAGQKALGVAFIVAICKLDFEAATSSTGCKGQLCEHRQNGRPPRGQPARPAAERGAARAGHRGQRQQGRRGFDTVRAGHGRLRHPREPARDVRDAAGHGLPAPRDGAAPPAARRAAGPEMFARGRRRRVRDRLRVLHARARHGRPAAELRRGGARARAAVARAPRAREPLRGAHRDGPRRDRRQRPRRAVRVGRQHAGVGVFGAALLHFRGDDRHRGGELSGPVRAGFGVVERPVARLQHREVRPGREKVRAAALRRQGHGREF